MSEKRDYRDTVFLPTTDFPMKAGLPQKEPGILARCKIASSMRKFAKVGPGRQEIHFFTTGPPYANGDIHIGHASTISSRTWWSARRLCWERTRPTFRVGMPRPSDRMEVEVQYRKKEAQ